MKDNTIPFEKLDRADLDLDAVYVGGENGDPADDPVQAGASRKHGGLRKLGESGLRELRPSLARLVRLSQPNELEHGRTALRKRDSVLSVQVLLTFRTQRHQHDAIGEVTAGDHGAKRIESTKLNAGQRLDDRRVHVGIRQHDRRE